MRTEGYGGIQGPKSEKVLRWWAVLQAIFCRGFRFKSIREVHRYASMHGVWFFWCHPTLAFQIWHEPVSYGLTVSKTPKVVKARNIKINQAAPYLSNSIHKKDHKYSFSHYFTNIGSIKNDARHLIPTMPRSACMHLWWLLRRASPFRICFQALGSPMLRFHCPLRGRRKKGCKLLEDFEKDSSPFSNM